MQGLKQVVTTGNLATGTTTTASTSSPAELNHSTTRGIVLGAGVDIHALVIHITPELRYTRWGAQNILDANGGIHSNQNQAEFPVGSHLLRSAVGGQCCPRTRFPASRSRPEGRLRPHWPPNIRA